MATFMGLAIALDIHMVLRQLDSHILIHIS